MKLRAPTKQEYVTAAELALMALVVASNGKGGAKIITRFAKEYLKKQEKVRGAKKLNEQAFRTTLSRLRADGLVEMEVRGIWNVLPAGRKLIAPIIALSRRREAYAASDDDAGKITTVVIFDIPESKKKKREFLRAELVALGFVLAQKSVWTGTRTLPREFIAFLKEEKLLDHVRIFSVRESGTLA